MKMNKRLNKFILVLLLFIVFTFFSGLKTYGYGFGFKRNNDNIKPDIGSYESILEETNSYYVKNTNELEIFLTFDAGYDNGNLDKILDVLKEKEVKAIFFVTGDFLNRFTELAKRIVIEGHMIGNHTYSHPNITKLDNQKIMKEVLKLEETYYSIFNNEMPKYFRPPEGEFDKKSLMTIKDMGYKTIFWSIAYKDWNPNEIKGIDYTVNQVLSNLHSGAIILLHTVSYDNANALSKIIDETRGLGYEFKSLNEL